MEVQNEKKFITDSVLNRVVSLFNPGKDGPSARPVWDHQKNRPKGFNLLDLLVEEPGEDLALIIDRIRKPIDQDERTRLKKQIPAFTPSGLFAHRRKGGLIAHTGLIALDIDAKHNAERLTNYAELKSELAKIEYVAYAGQSVSGTGYWALIPIKDPTRHKQHFQALEIAFGNAGLIIDNACSDVTRLRYWSYDPDAYFNHFARTWQSEYEAPQIIKPSSPTYRTDAGGKPWEAFNEAHNIVDVLEGYGWTILSEKGNEVDLTRPGKNEGKSAVAFLDSNKVYVWSSTPGLPTQTLLSPFDLVKHYEHGGDAKATVRALKQTAL